MTHSTTKADNFRVLDANEMDAVSGGENWCVTQATEYHLGDKGVLEVGSTTCDSMPGLVLPYVRWHPGQA